MAHGQRAAYQYTKWKRYLVSEEIDYKRAKNTPALTEWDEQDDLPEELISFFLAGPKMPGITGCTANGNTVILHR